MMCLSVLPARRSPAPQLAFTLIECLIALALLMALVAMAVPAYTGYVDQANIAQAKTDIRSLEQAIARFEAGRNALPDTLTDIGASGKRDPWGNPYRYLRIAGAGLKDKAQLRKDRFLVPINSDYDLYSMGKDGDSKAPLTAKASRDDIIRANNGAFIGRAVDY